MKKKSKNNKSEVPEVTDEWLEKVVDGLTPEMIQVKSQSYQEEFNQYLEDMGEDPESNQQLSRNEMLFRSFISHKLAVMDTVLTKIINHLQ